MLRYNSYTTGQARTCVNQGLVTALPLKRDTTQTLLSSLSAGVA